MCDENQPEEIVLDPDTEIFDSVGDFLAAIKPGMELCTSDFTGWAAIESVEETAGPEGGFVVGRVRTTGATVRVPASTLIDIREGHCVRLDRVRATVNDQGWEAS